MEETEVPLEEAQETTLHHAKHAAERWISWVALTSAILAVLAAVTAMLSGHHANEAVIEQIRASDRWSEYQAKSIKSNILETKNALMIAAGEEAADKDKEKYDKYREEMSELAKDAKHEEASSAEHLKVHEVYASGVTMFQVAIAIAAISALTKRKRFWFVGLAFGCAGIGFMIHGFAS